MKLDIRFFGFWFTLFTITVWVTTILVSHIEWQIPQIIVPVFGGMLVIGMLLSTKYKTVKSNDKIGEQ